MAVRVVHFNYSSSGGAFIAANRIHEAVRPLVSSSGIHIAKSTFTKKITGKIDQQIGRITNPPITTTYFKGFGKTKYESYSENFDIQHLHWLPGISASHQLRGNFKPTIWTIHDMNPLTGICHASFNCDSFNGDCSNCPQTMKILQGYSRSLHNYKQKTIANTKDLIVVAPSAWMYEQMINSSIFKNTMIECIANPVSTQIFTPTKRNVRDHFNFPDDVMVIGYISEKMGKAKGGEDAKEILKQLKHNHHEKVAIVEIGNFEQEDRPSFVDINEAPVNEDQMSSVLASCDVLINTSKAENFPSILIEAQACGVPVVSLDVGGSKETFIPGQSGQVCLKSEMYSALEAYLQDLSLRKRHGKVAERQAVTNFSFERIGKSYLKTYQKLLE